MPKSEGAQIFSAQRAAERLLKRTQSERGAVLRIPRDELAALANDLATVSAIAARHHLEKATAGALPPDAFAGPVE